MKRIADALLAGIGLVVLLPLLAIIAGLIRWRMGAPVVFRQTRAGLHAKPFEIVKFRTMNDATDDEGIPLPDAERLTPLGHFLRSTSLDELPQLWNVLKGDMSLIGPRPMLIEFLPFYSPQQARRHEMRPGITGWAQVNGRNALSQDQKIALDVWYVDNRTAILDLRIAFLTILKVFRREGIGTVGETPAPNLNGERKSDSD